MRILICGGTRFYGLELVQQLNRAHHTVTVVSRSIQKETFQGVHYIQGEIGKDIEGSLEGEKYDFAVNNICMCKKDAEDYIEYVSKYAKNHILISSIGVYETNEKHRIPKEEDFNPSIEFNSWIDEPYHDKREAERLFMKEIPKGHLFILRPSVLIGQKDWTDRLGFYIQRLLDGGGIITLLDGNNYFHWAYDFQLAAVVKDIIENQKKYSFAIYNVAINQYAEFRKFLIQVASILNIKEFDILSMKKARITKLPYEGFLDPYGKEDCVCDTSRLASQTGAILDIQFNKLKEIVLERVSRMKIEDSPSYENRANELMYIEKYKKHLEKVIVKDFINIK